MKTAKLVLAVIFTLIFLTWFGARIVNTIIFDREIGGYLKRAADSNTIELAIKNLKVVLKNVNANGMTSGYTNVLYRTPNEDVGFWHDNLEASLKELQTVKPSATQLEKSNLLIKLRETLVDHKGGEGVKVTIPPGIAIYPNNVLYAFWAFGSFILAVLFWILWASHDDYGRRRW